jgi:hypothetical protein
MYQQCGTIYVINKIHKKTKTKKKPTAFAHTPTPHAAA